MDIKTIAGLITAISSAAVIIWKARKWLINIIEGIKCQLRADMLHTYYKNKDNKKIRQYELENFIMSYNAYIALGGNSFIKEIHDEVMSWAVVS